jgi:hypothetical protein
LHSARIGIESGWDLGGIESAEAAAGSGADVDEASALAKSRSNDFHGASDLRQSAADGRGDGGIFVVDEANDFERGHLVEIMCSGKDLFGGKLAKVSFRGAGSGQVVRLSGVRSKQIILVPWGRKAGGESF